MVSPLGLISTMGMILTIMESYMTLTPLGHNNAMLCKCEWYDNTRGICVIQPHSIVEVNHKTRLRSLDVYILAKQYQ